MEDERRRTRRQNAGVAPARYGDSNRQLPECNLQELASRYPAFQDFTQDGERLNRSTTARSVSGVSSRTRRSSSTARSSTLRQNEVDLEMEERLSVLEDQHDQKVRTFKLLEFEVKQLTDTVEKLRQQHTEDEDEEIIQQNKDEIMKAEQQLQSKSDEAEIMRVNLEFDEKSLQRKKALLKKRAEVNKQLITEEDNEDNLSQRLSDDDEDETRLDLTVLPNITTTLESTLKEQMAKAAEALQAAKKQSSKRKSTDINDDPKKRSMLSTVEYSEEDLDLLVRLRRLQGGSCEVAEAPTTIPNTDPIINSNISNSASSTSEQFLQTLTRVLDKIPGHSTSPATDQFLARQVHGKDLPLFSGRPEEWVTFISCYRHTSVACKYNDTDNLMRLQKCLRDDALKTVQCLMSTPNNVQEIMQILELRYGQPEHIVDSLVEKARNLASFRDDRLDSLIEFGMAVKNLTTTIISLNCMDHLNNPSLLKELEAKLPVSLRMGWMTWVSDDNSRKKDLQHFCTWMERQTNAACRLCPPKSSQSHRVNDKDNKKERHQFGWRDKRNEDRVHIATENGQDRPLQPLKNAIDKKCNFCKKPGHRVNQCRSFSKENIDSKLKWVRDNRLCFACLNYGHGIGKCNSKKECGQGGCKQFHHTLIHKNKAEEATATIGHAMRTGHLSSRVQMMIVPVQLKGPSGTLTTLAMLDSGASITLLDSAIAKRLGLQGISQPLRYQGLHPTVNVPDSKSVKVEIITPEGNHLLENVRTTNYLPLPQQSVKCSLLNKWSHLKGLDIKKYEGDNPKMLIGLDNSDLIVSQEYIQGPANAPSAVRTKLGWILCGKTNEIGRTEAAFVIRNEEQDLLHQLVKHYFTTEAFGIKVTEEKPRCKDDKIAQVIMDKTIKKTGNSWESGLLWKNENLELPSSKSMALTRLYQMERKMDRDQTFAQIYADKIQEYVDKGFARKLSKEESKAETRRTFYLPHFMAKNPKKPKKFRFVFDAAAKVNGVSLNDNLLIGPDQLTSMPTVLFKFRQRIIGLTADIQDMFHRVRIIKQDAPAQRFLWRGMTRNREPDTYEMGVLIFGASCSPACAQEAKNKNANQFKDQYPEAVKAIIERHYVDDYLDSCDSVKEAVARFREVHEIHGHGGFNICKWVTSSNQVLDKIPDHLRAHGIKSISENDYSMERVLGLFWKPDEDHFTFSTTFLKVKSDIISAGKTPTKREVLALVMSIYDPLGFLSLFTVSGKMILQEIWRSQIGWDDEIAGSVQEKWIAWIGQLSNISDFQLPRCYSKYFSKPENLQLHIFCDASEQAFGAVAYFRITKGQEVMVSFIMSKAKVAPLKALSIPRMELQAAVLGSRLGKFIEEGHDIKVNQIYYWSDNQTVLCWLRSDSKKFKQFVGHRVGEIQELTNPKDWRWVSTRDNVADELTRDNKSCQYQPNSRWVKGPEFLRHPECEWPREKALLQPIDDLPEVEMKKEFLFVLKRKPQLLNITNYSSWNRLLRVTAYIFRIMKYCSLKRDQRGRFVFPLLPEHIEKAAKWLWRQSQEDSFPEEIALLRKGKEIPKTSRLQRLSPFLDEEGTLRLKGRLGQASELPATAKFPIILDPKNHLTKLLVMHYHIVGGHHGIERVVNEIRQKYHIINCRSAVKASWNNCQQCKNQRAKPAIPEMAPLPSVRLQSYNRPFHATGLDYFGPMEVKVGRRHEKRYGAIFTCLSTRAVHMEIASSLTTDSCVMAIRRFVGRRGCPSEIWSDNGTNFKGANIEMKLALMEFDQNKIINECTNRGITWKFIPPAAPHMGGSWERMVRSIKVALHATLKERYPSDETLQTLMVEAEHIVNCHPLTHVSLDPDDLEALTPNHFLIGGSSNVKVPGVFQEGDMCLRNKWRKAQVLANQFWQRWVREYLPTLLRRTKWFRQNRSIEMDDIVLEVNQNLERNSWPMGIVVKLYPGQDNLIRAVDVKFASGGVLKRPVSKLCVLDVRNPADSSEEQVDDD